MDFEKKFAYGKKHQIIKDRWMIQIIIGKLI